MKYDVTVDKKLYASYSEIRLGLLQFHAEIKNTAVRFWSHMNAEVLPQVRTAIHGKAWNEIPGGRGLRRMLPGVRWGVS